jgi:predicted metal-dependent hydrolase
VILPFKYNGQTVNIEINKKPIKNIYMKINLDNKIIVSAPMNSTEEFILDFIKKYLEKFLEIQKVNAIKVNINLENRTFHLFGQLETFDILESKSKDDQVVNHLVFRYKKYKINSKSIEDIIYSIYKKELLSYLIGAQYRKEQLMGVDHHDILIRMKQSA